jgi:hypothetical protein
MQPSSKADQYKPRWTHFHPQATVWLQNPFDEDIVFQVADEYDTPYQYRLPAGKVSELPGGLIATLGVKEVVDRLIMDTPDEVLRIWEKAVREKHESKVILRVKQPPASSAERTVGGEIDLSVKADDEEELDLTTPETVQEAKLPDTPFPDLKKNKRARGKSNNPIDNIAGDSLPNKDVQLVEED